MLLGALTHTHFSAQCLTAHFSILPCLAPCAPDFLAMATVATMVRHRTSSRAALPPPTPRLMAREHHSFVYVAATRLLVRHLSEHALARVRLCLLGGCVGAQLLGLPLQALLLGAHPLQGLPNLQGVWVGFGFG